MKKFTKEFMEFINRGNIFELATGVVIGTALKAVIDSIVKYLVMPIISYVTPNKAFDSWELGKFKIGLILESFLNFIIIGLVVFILLKIMMFIKNKTQKQTAEEVVEELERSEVLLTEIRDLLKAKK